MNDVVATPSLRLRHICDRFKTIVATNYSVSSIKDAVKLIADMYDAVDGMEDKAIVPVYDFQHASVLWDGSSLKKFLVEGLGVPEENVPESSAELFRAVFPRVEKLATRNQRLGSNRGCTFRTNGLMCWFNFTEDVDVLRSVGCVADNAKEDNRATLTSCFGHERLGGAASLSSILRRPDGEKTSILDGTGVFLDVGKCNIVSACFCSDMKLLSSTAIEPRRRRRKIRRVCRNVNMQIFGSRGGLPSGRYHSKVLLPHTRKYRRALSDPRNVRSVPVRRVRI